MKLYLNLHLNIFQPICIHNTILIIQSSFSGNVSQSLTPFCKVTPKFPRCCYYFFLLFPLTLLSTPPRTACDSVGRLMPASPPAIFIIIFIFVWWNTVRRVNWRQLPVSHPLAPAPRSFGYSLGEAIFMFFSATQQPAVPSVFCSTLGARGNLGSFRDRGRFLWFFGHLRLSATTRGKTVPQRFPQPRRIPSLLRLEFFEIVIVYE